MGVFGRMSTQSVLITVDRNMADQVYGLALQYGEAHLYIGKKLDAPDAHAR